MNIRALRARPALWGLGTPVAAYLTSRFTVLVAMWLADVAVADRSFFDLGKRWDGGWYFQTALVGYPHEVPTVAGRAVQSTLGFFPLFPMAARAVAVLPGVGPLTAAVAISLVGGLVATVLVWRLADVVWDRATADRAAVLFAFLPGSFVFSIAYSEGLMLALSAACLVLLYRQRWLLAGLAAALATATRPNALALVAAAAVAAVLAIRRDRTWSALVAPALAPAGFVAFNVFLRLRTGEWNAYSRTQSEGWGQVVSPWATPRVIADFWRNPFADVNVALLVVGTVLGVACVALLLAARPPAIILAYTAGLLVLCLSSEILGMRPRFFLTAFPLVYGVARVARGQAHSIAVGVEAAVLGSLTFVTMTTMLATP